MFEGQIVNESLKPKAIFHLIQKSDFKKNLNDLVIFDNIIKT
jgi:hypothetical protein